MKKTITYLVPTDFSAVSRTAAMYAARMAAHVGARVRLLSVIEMDTSEVVLRNWAKLEGQMRRSNMKELGKMQLELRAAMGGKVMIECDITTGIPKQEAIAQYAADQKTSVIVMGTKGAAGLQKIVSGSNTTSLIGATSVPVVAVPAKAAYHGVKRMVYATDLKNVATETKVISRVAALFNSEIMILHCLPKKTPKTKKNHLAQDLIKKVRYPSISYHEVQSDSIDKAISTFLVEAKADMLVMFTHELGFYEKLFGKSVTRTMAFQTRVPLLVFNRG